MDQEPSPNQDSTTTKRKVPFFLYILLFTTLLFGVGYGVFSWQQRKIDSLQAQDTSIGEKVSKEMKVDTVNTVPPGFVRYENKVLGLSFAYPSTWGSVKFSINNGYIESSFSDNTDVVFGGPTTEYTTLGRGGIPQDQNAYTKINGEYYAISVYSTDVGPVSNLNKISNTKSITEKEALNVKVLLIEYNYSEFIGYGYKSLIINLSNNQPAYGIAIVFKNNAKDDTEAINKLISTIEVR